MNLYNMDTLVLVITREEQGCHLTGGRLGKFAFSKLISSSVRETQAQPWGGRGIQRLSQQTYQERSHRANVQDLCKQWGLAPPATVTLCRHVQQDPPASTGRVFQLSALHLL